MRVLDTEDTPSREIIISLHVTNVTFIKTGESELKLSYASDSRSMMKSRMTVWFWSEEDERPTAKIEPKVIATYIDSLTQINPLTEAAGSPDAADQSLIAAEKFALADF